MGMWVSDRRADQAEQRDQQDEASDQWRQQQPDASDSGSWTLQLIACRIQLALNSTPVEFVESRRPIPIRTHTQAPAAAL